MVESSNGVIHTGSDSPVVVSIPSELQVIDSDFANREKVCICTLHPVINMDITFVTGCTRIIVRLVLILVAQSSYV